MKELIFSGLIIILFSCKKTSTEPTPNDNRKTYNVSYELSCIGDYKSVFNLIYIVPENGEIRNEQIILNGPYISTSLQKAWIRTFVGRTGDHVSMYCKPPFTGTTYNYFSSNVALTIKYNGIILGFSEATSDTSGIASVNGILP